MKHTPEEIAELLKERPNQPHYIAALVRRAVKAEREACAKVCDELSDDFPIGSGERYITKSLAKDIRARGEVPR